MVAAHIQSPPRRTVRVGVGLGVALVMIACGGFLVGPQQQHRTSTTVGHHHARVGTAETAETTNFSRPLNGAASHLRVHFVNDEELKATSDSFGNSRAAQATAGHAIGPSSETAHPDSSTVAPTSAAALNASATVAQPIAPNATALVNFTFCEGFLLNGKATIGATETASVSELTSRYSRGEVEEDDASYCTAPLARVYNLSSSSPISNPTPPPLHPATAAETRRYFAGTLLVVMLSPSRYHLVPEVVRHYAPFFDHIALVGPVGAVDNATGRVIYGCEVGRGARQYICIASVMRRYLSEDASLVARHAPPKGYEKGLLREDREAAISATNAAAAAKGTEAGAPYPHPSSPSLFPFSQPPSAIRSDNASASITGLLFTSDDVLLQPWAMAARRYSRLVPWSPQMGIGHIRSWYKVSPVPMMAMEPKLRRPGWVHWRKNFLALNAVLAEGGPLLRGRLAAAARATHPILYKWSRYNRLSYSAAEAAEWSVFFTIADVHYVPRRLWRGYVAVAALMERHAVMQELAIPTILRALHPTHEELQMQFYWFGQSAELCLKYAWDPLLDGFHRCRHDHAFAALIYGGGDTARAELHANATAREAAKVIGGLLPPMQPPRP